MKRALLVLALMLLAGEAQAADRFAIVIGQNRGEQDEALLRFAERDATRMADVMMRLGGVSAEDLLLLLSPDRDALVRALASFRARVTKGSSLFVYYSGHADRASLHLAGTRLGFGDLKAALRGMGSDVTVLLVDACRSGGLLRAKGAASVDPFELEVADELAAQGMAIITSSAENEDAQESERLEGGIFTHHLLTGMLGAADQSADRRVSLAEAYRYAYGQTLAATSVTAVVQHPTYAFDVQGGQEIVLTRVDDVAGRGRMRLVSGGQYLVLEQFGAREVVAELEARPATELSLTPGVYLVRKREDSAVFEKNASIVAGGSVDIDADEMARVPYRHAVRKGYGLEKRRAWSLGADVEAMGVLLDGTDPWLFGAVTAQLDFADIALQARVRYGASSGENARVTLDQRLLGLDLGLFHVFDIGRHGVGFGLRGGLDWLSQTFESEGDAPATDQIMGRVGPFARIELALGGAVTLQLDGGLDVYLLEVGTNAPELQARPVPTVSLGVGVLLP